jgi:GGDEF domain-containing protein
MTSCFAGEGRVCHPAAAHLSRHCHEDCRIRPRGVTRITIPGLPRFTVSIGVARHEPEESIDELFKRVDDALYRAKNDGRNKVLAA